MAAVTYVVSTGAIVAFCAGITASTQEVLEITDAQLEEVISEPGWTVVNGALAAPASATSA